MTDKLNEMWAAFEAYQSKAHADEHGKSWRLMCKERTGLAAWAAYLAAPEGSAAQQAAGAADVAVDAAAVAAAVSPTWAVAAAEALAAGDAVAAEKYAQHPMYAISQSAKSDDYAQRAIDAIKQEVKP